jgi:hypothetical protein
VAELGVHRYLDLHNRYEADEAASRPFPRLTTPRMMELVFRIRDSGLVDTYGCSSSP